MTTTDDIASQPHFVAFVARGTSTLTPCVSPLAKGEAIDDHYAIYPDRETADRNRHQWNSKGVTYFSVPATALFNMKPKTTEYTFTLKAGQ